MYPVAGMALERSDGETNELVLSIPVHGQHDGLQVSWCDDTVVTEADEVGHEVVDNSLLVDQPAILGCKLEAGIGYLFVGNEPTWTEAQSDTITQFEFRPTLCTS